MTYTCVTCRVKFTGEGGLVEASCLQKKHFQSDWHRFNLKRKVSHLPPITAEAFEEKISAIQKEQNCKNEVNSWHCIDCSRKFSSEASFKNHINSKKHRHLKKKKNSNFEKEKISIESNLEELEEEEVSDDEWFGDPLPPSSCFFCSHSSADIESNLIHMSSKHSFFLPDPDYIIDIKGLMEHIGKKVGKFHMCLWCGVKGKRFFETKQVQQHMVTKGHCKVWHYEDAVVEFAAFYDYSKSYPDFEEKQGVLVEEEESFTEDFNLSLDDTGFQLILPSGMKIGHRALFSYYKQNLKPDKQVVGTGYPSKNYSSLNRALLHYKGLGWTGISGKDAQKKAKDLSFMNRLKTEQWAKLGINTNKLQKHFRDQVFGI